MVTTRATSCKIKTFYLLPTVYLCILYGSQNKQPLLHLHGINRLVLQRGWRVFTARYELNFYVKLRISVCKGSNKFAKWDFQMQVVFAEKQKMKFLISQYSHSSNYQWRLILNNVVQTNDTKYSDIFTAAFVNTVIVRWVVITLQHSTCRQPEINGHTNKMVAQNNFL
jgi:hypothetical protein